MLFLCLLSPRSESKSPPQRRNPIPDGKTEKENRYAISSPANLKKFSRNLIFFIRRALLRVTVEPRDEAGGQPVAPMTLFRKVADDTENE